MLHRIFALVLVSVALCGCESRTEFTGGTRLVFRYDPAESETSPEALRAELVAVIEKRLELAEIRQFRVQSENENRISVDVPTTVSDLEEIKGIVTTGGRFAIHLVSGDEVSNADFDGHEKEEQAYRDRLGKWRELLREWSARKGTEPASSEPRPEQPAPPERIVRRDSDGQRILLENTPTGHVTERVIEDAYIVRDDQSRPTIAIGFTTEGAARLGAMTERNIGRRVAIVLDGMVFSTPVVQARIDRRAQMGAVFGPDQIPGVMIFLRSGPLPVALEFLGEASLSTLESE